MSAIEVNSRQTAVIDRSMHWRPIDEQTPRGAKLQLIRRADGVAQCGILGRRETHYTHWAPLPSFAPEDDHGR